MPTRAEAHCALKAVRLSMIPITYRNSDDDFKAFCRFSRGQKSPHKSPQFLGPRDSCDFLVPFLAFSGDTISGASLM